MDALTLCLGLKQGDDRRRRRGFDPGGQIVVRRALFPDRLLRYEQVADGKRRMQGATEAEIQKPPSAERDQLFQQHHRHRRPDGRCQGGKRPTLRVVPLLPHDRLRLRRGHVQMPQQAVLQYRNEGQQDDRTHGKVSGLSPVLGQHVRQEIRRLDARGRFGRQELIGRQWKYLQV